MAVPSEEQRPPQGGTHGESVGAGAEASASASDQAPLPDGLSRPGEVIRSMARAARCFVTYDARNETVRQFIAAYRTAAGEALAEHGQLTYTVGPYEICYRGEAVYREEDRERSLAFRLFRDGVRSFTIRPDVPWEELLRLLEILSVRCSRIRSQEDDTLTLLRQAGFRFITFEVIEVYVPAEENPEASDGRELASQRVRPPEDWDLPLPKLAGTGAVALRPVPDDALQALRAECSEQATVDAAVQVVKDMLELTGRGGGATAAVVGLLDEVCKFFVVELRPRELCWALQESRKRLGENVRDLQARFCDATLLERFLRDPEDIEIEALMPLFSMVSGDHLDRVVERFVTEPDDRLRRPLKNLLARLAVGRPEVLLNRLGSVPPDRVVDLFNVVCVVAPPERTIESAYTLVEHASPEVQLGGLEVLQGAPTDARFHQTMQTLLQSPTPRVRVKAANIYGRRGGTKAYNTLSGLLERLAKEGLEPQEASALGKGMFQAAREAALPLLRSFVRPGAVNGLLLRARFGPKGFRMLRWAAVSGLADDAAAASRELLTWLAEHSDAELALHCREALGEKDALSRG